MSFQPPITIHEAIKNIDNRTYLLPSIQREFTWWEDQIRWLFDSLMQEYPINSFLLWNVQGDTKDKFKYYEILKNYVERYKTHNEEFSTKGFKDFYGILDGQQRLTSLYIGLKGSFSWHQYYASWSYSEDNFPSRRLYVNISEKPEEDEEGQEYDFRFLTEPEYKKEEDKWFLVGDILNIKNVNDLLNLIQTTPKLRTDLAKSIISRLHEVVHLDRSINCYIEKNQNIDKALNIFIRINKDGTPLDFSDLVMSTIVSDWKGDARKLVTGLSDEIFRNQGFLISKDLILKTYLYLYSEDIRFKVNNFTIDKASEFETYWKDIRSSILTTFKTIRDYGFVDQTLTSKNAVLPIIYFIHHNKYFEIFHSQVKFESERKLIKKWLHLVLLKQIFGASSDTVLRKIRIGLKGKSSFPAKEIVSSFAGTNKNMTLDDDSIEKILKVQKDHPLAFSILALLYPNLDYKNGNFHKDHLHPATCFSDNYLSNIGISGDNLNFYKNSENWNSILNLQFLDANENKSKNKGELKPWIDSETAKLDMTIGQFCSKHLIPEKLDFLQFRQFILERKQVLSNELRQQLTF